MAEFLPMSKSEMQALGWEQADIIVVTGDAYIDHPSFGPAIIARVLENAGYKVAVISQPDWHDLTDFRKLGEPRLAFFVSGGNIDSMVCHYTAARKPRSDDYYTPGGKAGKRPDRAPIVYANMLRRAYSNKPIVIGGIEASLRRCSHYDYWTNKVRHSVLVDSGADLLVYGMGELASAAIADALDAGIPVSQITYVNGTCYKTPNLENVTDYTEIPSHMEVCEDKIKYCKAFMHQMQESDGVRGKRLVQAYERGYVVINPPSPPLTTQQMDEVYELPYTRLPHPSYTEHIPAIDEVEFSLTSCRGCFGGCSFCAITYHQGRIIQSRSHNSIINEARLLTEKPNFKGYIHDVGGPTANFRAPACKNQLEHGACKNKACLSPRCKNLEVSHDDYISLLRKLRDLPKIKKVFVRSGLRFDYIMYDKCDRFLRELIEHHVSGQLKVAPEHVSSKVLALMGKPENKLYNEFVRKYMALNNKLCKKQFIVPYLMSSHPGSDMNAASELARYLKKNKMRPEQVQDFYPTPATLSTTMYYTGLDPRTLKKVYVPKTVEEKAAQRAMLQYYRVENHARIREALIKARRSDLIGYGENCLVPPEKSFKPSPKSGRARSSYGSSSRKSSSKQSGKGKRRR